MTGAHRLAAATLALCLLAGFAPRLPGQTAATPVPVNGSPVPSLSGPGDLYLALGDSIAAGIGASDPATRSYPAIVRGYLARLAGRPVDLADLAVPGETSRSLLDGGQWQRAADLIAQARRGGKRVSPITVTIGGNDLLQATDDAGREAALTAVGENLNRLFANIRAATADAAGTPTADLIATTYYDPTGSDPTRPGSEGWWGARLNGVIAGETTGAGGHIADVAPLFAGHQTELTYAPADIHPTNAGHRVIADAVWRACGYDREPPTIDLRRPAAGVLPRPVPTVLAVITDRVGVSAASVWVDGARAGDLVYLDDLGAYVFAWDTRALPPGPHRLTVEAEDAAGNVARVGRSVIVPPAAPGQATPATSPAA